MEKSYCIIYEVSSEATSSKISDAIKIAGKWWHYFDKAWIVRTDIPLMELKNFLKVYLQEEDKLLVFEVCDRAAWAGFNADACDWLTNFL